MKTCLILKYVTSSAFTITYQEKAFPLNGLLNFVIPVLYSLFSTNAAISNGLCKREDKLYIIMNLSVHKGLL